MEGRCFGVGWGEEGRRAGRGIRVIDVRARYGGRACACAQSVSGWLVGWLAGRLAG